MASKFFERRAVRNQLKTYLEARGWTGLTWAEGFGPEVNLPTVVPPFITIILDDMGRESLEMGNNPSINKLFARRVQANVYMESEDRVNAITDDISDFFDIETISIKNNNNIILGTMISDTESIISEVFPPNLVQESNLEWEGVVACTYEAHYPNG